jgi:hypothetical protein
MKQLKDKPISKFSGSDICDLFRASFTATILFDPGGRYNVLLGNVSSY